LEIVAGFFLGCFSNKFGSHSPGISRPAVQHPTHDLNFSFNNRQRSTTTETINAMITAPIKSMHDIKSVDC